MRKRFGAGITSALFIAAVAIAPVLQADASSIHTTLLRTSASHAQSTLTGLVKGKKAAPSVKGDSQSSNTQNPDSPVTAEQTTEDETPITTTSTQPSTDPAITDPSTPKPAESEPTQPSEKPILKPIKDDCMVPPPGYLLDKPDADYTLPELCEGPYPLPLPDPPIRKCPDHWYEDRMPSPVERMPYERQYFIIDGKRHAIANYDLDWILIYCPIDIEYVY